MAPSTPEPPPSILMTYYPESRRIMSTRCHSNRKSSRPFPHLWFNFSRPSIVLNMFFILLLIAPSCLSDEAPILDSKHKKLKVLPTNEHIPREELASLSLQVIPSLTDRLKLPPSIGGAGVTAHLHEQCEVSTDSNNHTARRVRLKSYTN